jgi:hypothetical protein
VWRSRRLLREKKASRGIGNLWNNTPTPSPEPEARPSAAEEKGKRANHDEGTADAAEEEAPDKGSVEEEDGDAKGAMAVHVWRLVRANARVRERSQRRGDGAERRKHKGKEKAVKEQASKKKKSKRSGRKGKARKVSTCGDKRWLPRRRERREGAASDMWGCGGTGAGLLIIIIQLGR